MCIRDRASAMVIPLNSGIQSRQKSSRGAFHRKMCIRDRPDALTGLYSAGQTMVLGIQTVDTGVFGGILLGLLTAFVYEMCIRDRVSTSSWAAICPLLPRSWLRSASSRCV